MDVIINELRTVLNVGVEQARPDFHKEEYNGAPIEKCSCGNIPKFLYRYLPMLNYDCRIHSLIICPNCRQRIDRVIILNKDNLQMKVNTLVQIWNDFQTGHHKKYNYKTYRTHHHIRQLGINIAIQEKE